MHGRGVTARDVHLSRARVLRSQPPRALAAGAARTHRGDLAPDARIGACPLLL